MQAVAATCVSGAAVAVATVTAGQDTVPIPNYICQFSHTALHYSAAQTELHNSALQTEDEV